VSKTLSAPDLQTHSKPENSFAQGMENWKYSPLRDLTDIKAIEEVAIEQRILRWDFALNLLDGCRLRPDKVAIHATDQGNIDGPVLSWTFSELEQKSFQIANLLRASGILANDPIAIISPTVPGLFATFIGCLLAARPFPINWMYDHVAIRDLIIQSGVKAVVALGPTPGFQIWQSVTAALADIVDAPRLFTLRDPFDAAHENDLLNQASQFSGQQLSFERQTAQRRDIACYVHSGGTTGHPKIVKILHGGMVYRQWAANQGLAFTPDDVVLSDTPLFHIGGLLVRGLVSTADGQTCVIPSIFGARDKRYIENYWRYVARFGVTQISGVPTTLSVLSKQPPTKENISSLRPYFATGSTAIAVSIQERLLQNTGCNTLQSYGLTENTSHVALDPRDGQFRRGCSGLRVPYTQIRIVIMAKNGESIERECELNEVGMVLVRGPGVSGGYLDSQQNRGVFLPEGDLVTGDLGCLDEDGFIRISGRQKDIIIRGGHNIEPRIIEDALMLSPYVALAAAVGKPDAHAGELPVVYVQLQPNAVVSADDLLEFASAHINERVAVPKEIFFIDQIPLTSVGKPQKNILQIDSAKRAFTQALESVKGRWTLNVESVGGGLLVKIAIHQSHHDVRQEVEKILSAYAIRYEIHNS
jgi:fatty-acyl-CoA synthase